MGNMGFNVFSRAVAMRRYGGALLFTLGAVGAIAAAPVAWDKAVTIGAQGYVLGNPNAKVSLAQYISYSCSHCAHFALKNEAELKRRFVDSGKVKFEMHPIIRNPYDITATLLAQCGPKERFSANHHMIMASQRSWLAGAENASDAQIKNWQNPARGRIAMARDLGLYALMEVRGYSAPEIDQCLSDTAKADRLLSQSQATIKATGLVGTPSFAINGKLLKDINTFDALAPAIEARIGSGK